MKIFFAFALFVVLLNAAYSAPYELEENTENPRKKEIVPVIRHVYNDDGFQGIFFSFSSDDRTPKKSKSKHSEAKVSDGSYTFKDDYGDIFMIKWLGDKNGYGPKEDHLPRVEPPPIPLTLSTSMAFLANTLDDLNDFLFF